MDPEMEIFLNYPGLRRITKENKIVGYRGMLFVNETYFKIEIQDSEIGWRVNKEFTNEKINTIIATLNSSQFENPAKYLNALKHDLKLLYPAHVPIPVEIYKRVLEEYQEFVNFYVYIEHVKLAHDLSHIEVIYVDDSCRNHPVTIDVNYDGGKLFKIGKAELPEVPVEASEDSLILLFEVFIGYVQQFQTFFNVMDVIDQHLWIVEPEAPTGRDRSRRVILAKGLSAVLTIDPKFPTNMPIVRPLGTLEKVDALDKELAKNSVYWDREGDVLDELLKFFDLAVFPSRCTSPESELASCGICLCLRGDSNELPESFCKNALCAQSFHTDCLCKFLQRFKQRQQRKVTGQCPFCKQPIECEVLAETT